MSDNGGRDAGGKSAGTGSSGMTGAFGGGNGIPGRGGIGAGGRAGFTGSALDFFLLFLNPMTSPKQEGGLNSIEPYRKKPQNYMHYIPNLFDYLSPALQN